MLRTHSLIFPMRHSTTPSHQGLQATPPSLFSWTYTIITQHSSHTPHNIPISQSHAPSRIKICHHCLCTSLPRPQNTFRQHYETGVAGTAKLSLVLRPISGGFLRNTRRHSYPRILNYVVFGAVYYLASRGHGVGREKEGAQGERGEGTSMSSC
jgi:hypothetical protein